MFDTNETITRNDLFRALDEQGVKSPFFERHPTDVLGNCGFHKIQDDVTRGHFSLEDFALAHKHTSEQNSSCSLDDIRTQATIMAAMRPDEPANNNDEDFEVMPAQQMGGWYNEHME